MADYLRAECEFAGGPLDGDRRHVKLIDCPGKLPIYTHSGGTRKYPLTYVYQACRFLEDGGGPPLRMEFVQILRKGEKLQ